MTWCVRYFNRFLLQSLNHLDSARFPFLIVDCSVVVFDMEIKFNIGEYVLVNSWMKVRDGESKFRKGRFHKILQIINRVARRNSNNRSGKGLHAFIVDRRVMKNKPFQFYLN